MAETADLPTAAPSFKKRGANKNIRKRPATPPPDNSDSDASDYTEDERGARVKRRKKDGVSLAAPRREGAEGTDLSKATKYEADRTTAIRQNDDATKSSVWYTDAALAADNAVATARARRQEREDEGPPPGDGVYKGTANYGTHIQPSREARTVGPVKAPTNVRTITVTDFAPDVCKDYKQTGFCGFGDSCKFLHAREDYKQGWQLDKEWEKAGGKSGKPARPGSGAASKPEGGAEGEGSLEEIPFKCIICKEDYRTPVVTKCGHYFCEKCAMGRYMREKKRTCANCGADTGGSFGVARKLKELLGKKRAREEQEVKGEGEKEEG